MNSEIINTIAQVFEALGTVGAVILALFGEVVLEKWFGPLLKLKLSEREEKKTEAGHRIDCYLTVINAKRRSAKSVRVLLTKIEEKRADGDFVPTYSRPLQLVWPPRNIAEQFQSISGHDQVPCSLGTLGEGWKGFRLSTYLSGEDFPEGFVEPKVVVRVTLKAMADNCESSSPLILEIVWDGKWEDNMENHFVVKSVQRPKL